jgi:SAM-dependent methyltransferase
VVYDLGCGDGRIVCTAVRHFGARAVGVDIDPQRIRECDESLRHLPPQDRKFARFILGSFFDLDLTECSVLTLYLLPKINVKLRPKLLWELRPGARIIANTFSMGDWEPDDVLETHHRTLYKWVVPAWLQGKWKAVIDAPPSLGGRRKLTLELERRFQILTGKAWVFGKSVPLGTGRIRGHAFSFRLPDPTLGRGLTLSGVMDGPHLRGTWALDNNEAAGPWGARRDPA